MTWLAGVDGCKAGWFRVCRESQTGEVSFAVVRTVHDLVSTPPHPEIVAIDIPIGLPEAHDRPCDKEARSLLGWPRRNSVFAVPVRSAIRASSREEASELTKAADGRRVGVQTWGIYPKIQEVDEALVADRNLRAAFREVHPEVSFWAWNGRRPMIEGKKKRTGLAARLALAESWLGPLLLERGRGSYRKTQLADDDILDAVAGLWTAHRMEAGSSETLPESPPRDGTGLPMQIVF